jgi:shikimate dehydrogenase
MALQPAGSEISNKPCVIIGSGGAARSITHVLIRKFKISKIVFVALYPEQAEALIKSLGKNEVEFSVVPSNEAEIEKAVKSSVLIVNATAIGMYPNCLESPISNKEWISSGHTVFDVIYRPLKTRLLSDAKDAGAIALGGLDMFIHQGAAAFRLWTGEEMPLAEIRRVLEEKLRD